MTVRYAGPGGLDTNNGLSWATRKLTLSGVEATPVVAGDICYVGPGVFREQLTVGVSGSAGLPIVYIGDVDGSHTDGIGGIVRVTGSDDDQTATRANCITATSINYRTLRGFAFDTTTSHTVNLATACGNWIFEDCCLGPLGINVAQMNISGTGITNTVRRCVFVGGRSIGINIVNASTLDNAAHLIANCLFLGGINTNNTPIIIDRVGGIAVRNCTFFCCGVGVRVRTALTVGQTTTVNNCLFTGCGTTLQSVTAPGTNEEITENYNAFWGNGADRSNVSTGANSNVLPPIFQPPMLLSGVRYPWNPFDLSQWSPLRRLAGVNMSSDGLFGIPRPVTDAKKSWGALQYSDLGRDTITKQAGVSSLKLADAGIHQMFVPVTNVATTFSGYVYREANYAGTLPQMIIKQPGQADVTVTAVGAVSTWELLTTTLTPAAVPTYVVVEFRSNNSANSGSFAAYFDSFKAQ